MDRDAKGSLLELHREYQKLAKTYNMLTTVDKVKAMIQLMRHGFKGNSKNKRIMQWIHLQTTQGKTLAISLRKPSRLTAPRY